MGVLMMNGVISSTGNVRIKYLQKLYLRKYRKKEGKFILEGYRIINEALNSNADFETIFLTPSFYDSPEGQKITNLVGRDMVVLVEEGLLNELADTVTPQGVIGVVDEPVYHINDFIDKGIILVLDRLQDPGNMGTVIRTAVAAGVAGIIVLKGSVDIYNLKVLRATMGAVFNIPIITDIELAAFKELLVSQLSTYNLIAADLSGKEYYYNINYNPRSMLVIGNEAHGVSREILEMADRLIKIPIIGDIDSLNAAIAAGIIMYKALEEKIE
ncbi:RNA methyltransferase [Iocasia frigidifontis]|uniref:RNA methyltransferase n=3 Tax=Halanaerobiaceae TaxID=972 RepID=A0A8A7KL57_9FIRM|nr:RNA methyltransferase [Iocasia fonsfrigidae]